MAQRSAPVDVIGNVVKHERKSGEFTDREDPTREVSYDFIEARVVTPEFDVVEVRFDPAGVASGAVKIPEPDELVRLRCEARPSGGNVKLTVQSVHPAADQLARAH